MLLIIQSSAVLGSEFNWRPSFLVVSFGNKHRLTSFAETLRKGHSLLFCCSILKGDYRQSVVRRLHDKQPIIRKRRGNRDAESVTGYLPIRHFTHKKARFSGRRSLGFNELITTDGNYRKSMQIILQNAGLGALRPNTLMLNLPRNIGGDSNVKDDDEVESGQFVEMLRDSLLSG